MVEWESLQLCTDCCLVPLLFTPQHVIWEMKMGLGGYLIYNMAIVVQQTELRMVKHILIIREEVSETSQ